MISPTYDFHEICFVRKTNVSFLKILFPTHSGLQSSESANGSTGTTMTLSLRNLGDATASFKIRACRRQQPAQHQAGDTVYTDLVGYTNVSVVPGGLLHLQIETLGNNLFSLVALSDVKTKLMIECRTNSNQTVIVWKKDDEMDRDTDQDQFLQDESPTEFQAGSGAWPWGGQGQGGITYASSGP